MFQTTNQKHQYQTRKRYVDICLTGMMKGTGWHTDWLPKNQLQDTEPLPRRSERRSWSYRFRVALGSKSNDAWRIKPQGRRCWCEESTKWYQMRLTLGWKTCKKTGELQRYDKAKDDKIQACSLFWHLLGLQSRSWKAHLWSSCTVQNSMPKSLNKKQLFNQAAKESIWLLFRRWA